MLYSTDPPASEPLWLGFVGVRRKVLLFPLTVEPSPLSPVPPWGESRLIPQHLPHPTLRSSVRSGHTSCCPRKDIGPHSINLPLCLQSLLRGSTPASTVPGVRAMRRALPACGQAESVCFLWPLHISSSLAVAALCSAAMCTFTLALPMLQQRLKMNTRITSSHALLCP